MIKMYSRENCMYCDEARSFLKNAQIPFTELKLNEDFTRESLRKDYPTATTYPVIILDGFYIGGCNELKEQFSNKDNRKFLND